MKAGFWQVPENFFLSCFMETKCQAVKQPLGIINGVDFRDDAQPTVIIQTLTTGKT